MLRSLALTISTLCTTSQLEPKERDSNSWLFTCVWSSINWVGWGPSDCAPGASQAEISYNLFERISHVSENQIVLSPYILFFPKFVWRHSVSQSGGVGSRVVVVTDYHQLKLIFHEKLWANVFYIFSGHMCQLNWLTTLFIQYMWFILYDFLSKCEFLLWTVILIFRGSASFSFAKLGQCWCAKNIMFCCGSFSK